MRPTEMNNSVDDDDTSNNNNNDTETLIKFRSMLFLTRKEKIYYFIIPLTVAAALGFLIGFLSGYFPKKSNVNDNGNSNVNVELLKYYESLIQDYDFSLLEKLSAETKAANIRENLRNMTSIPHLAGTEGDRKSAEYVYNKFAEQSLDYKQMIDYDVLLSYPDETKPNSLQFYNATDELIESIDIIEPILDPNVSYTGTPNPWLAFGLNGSIVSDEIYYVNFCSEQDFLFIVSLKINVTNKPVICRYGEIFRGDKVLIAQRYGASAVILYDDPKRSAPDIAKDEIYPRGEFLPELGTQRGTVFTGSGDPQTPLYPSTGNEFRVKESLVHGLPNIPAQVIGYKYAKSIFELLENNVEVNETWAGDMNITYTYGGKLSDDKKIGLNVYNQRRIVKTYNVVGMIKGTVEPDRYIMIGNHRDAWVFGSVDPTSGTATLVEMSRVLSELRRSHGWKPRRSIMFLSWGAEEYGLVGSTEWVEEFNKKLSANAVAYLNLDISVQGNYSYTAKSSPLLHDVIYNVTKNVKMTADETVYDRWLKYSPNANKTQPRISPELGAGSDYMAFQQRVGVACMDSRFNHENSAKYKSIGSGYPLYHTNYETFRLIDEIIDPGFNSFRLISIITAEIARVLADSLIIPFNTKNYAHQLRHLHDELVDDYGGVLTKQNIKLDGLTAAISNYTIASTNFHDRLDKIDRSHITEINQYNEQLRNLEKAFLNPQNIDREGYMHVISAPSLYNQYAGDGFPALNDAIYDANANPNEDNWDKVRLQLSIVIYAIHSACTILDGPDRFQRY